MTNHALETVLKRSVGRPVRLCFETQNGDSFSVAGDLLEVTDDYIKVYGMVETYINRKATVLTYFEVFERNKDDSRR